MERCLPTCQTMKCTQVERPVCALAEIGGALPQTFANECEMRRRECHTKQVLRILHPGPCQTPTKSGRKKKLRRNKSKRPTKAATLTSKFAINPKKVYLMLATPSPARSTSSSSTTTRITTTARMRPTKATSTSPSPMQFRQLMSLANPMVSVSRAVDAYNVYNIPDVGHDYGEITDSSLSIFLPEVGRVTEPYSIGSSSSTTTSTTTTATPFLATIRTTTLPETITIRSYSTTLMPSTTETSDETTEITQESEAITPGMISTQPSLFTFSSTTNPLSKAT
ncbi:integumentary mucin C.1 isoform X1 [Drosophila takahashii]